MIRIYFSNIELTSKPKLSTVFKLLLVLIQWAILVSIGPSSLKLLIK